MILPKVLSWNLESYMNRAIIKANKEKSMRKVFYSILLIAFGCSTSQTPSAEKPWDNGKVVVSANGRFLQHENGAPFFWLGDTGWLLIAKLNREEAESYLENRRELGFNVIQVMVLHEIPQVNFYGDFALVGADVIKPKVTPGSDPNDPVQYDFWDHLHYIVKTAEHRLLILLGKKRMETIGSLCLMT